MDAVVSTLHDLGLRLAAIEKSISNTGVTAGVINNNNMAKNKNSGRCQERRNKSACKKKAATTKKNAGCPSSWTRSQNPDFPALYKLIISFVRVCCCVSAGDYKVPCRAAAGIGRGLDCVSLPGDPKKVKLFKQNLASDFQRLIQAAVLLYIDKEKSEILGRIAALNPLDSEHAITVAMACLRKRHSNIAASSAN